MKNALVAIALIIAASRLASADGGNPEAATSPLASPVASDRILVVAPHPDDETIGAGGYLEQAAKVGAAIHVVIATDGHKRGRKITRYGESLRALSLLGIQAADVEFLDFPDGALSKQSNFAPRLQAICADFHPTIVIGTHPSDVHPDHAAVGRAIDALCQRAGHPLTAYFFVVHFPHYPYPDAYQPDIEESPAPKLADPISRWEALPLPSEAEEAKRAAVLEYHSQLLRRTPLRRGLLISFIRKSEVFAVRSY